MWRMGGFTSALLTPDGGHCHWSRRCAAMMTMVGCGVAKMNAENEYTQSLLQTAMHLHLSTHPHLISLVMIAAPSALMS